MDQPIRPKASNHHKPRIRVNVDRWFGIFATNAILLPRYKVRKQPDGTLVFTPNGHFRAGESHSLDHAVNAAVEHVREHMPWVPR